MKLSKIILGLFILTAIGLFNQQTVFCQSEKLDIFNYTPPKGWTQTQKEGVMVYSDINKSTNGFYILSVYPSTTSTGSPDKDFANEWNKLAINPFKAEENPKTETQVVE